MFAAQVWCFVKMDKLEYRTAIKFFRIEKSLRELCISLENARRDGLPKTAITPKTIESVHNIILDHRLVNVYKIVEAVGTSKSMKN